MFRYVFYSGELQHLKQQLRSVHKHRVNTYLREKKYNENIAINNFSDIYVEPRVEDITHKGQIKVEQLFSPGPFEETTPEKVLLVGARGFGKTMVVLSVLSMWLEGRLPTIENIFYFSMRHLSRISKNQWSLTDLLFTHQGIPKPRDDVVREMVSFVKASQSVHI